MKRTLEVSSRQEGAARRIVVKGDVDMDSSPRLLEAIRAGLREAAVLELDLSGVGYIDSSGIAVLVQGVKLARRMRGTFDLLDPSPPARAVIKLSQLEDFFRIRSSGEGGTA